MTHEQTSPEYVMALINSYAESDNRKYMDIADQYYHNRNDILDEKRFVIGRDSENNPSRIESVALSNNKLVHNFLRKLTHQKIGYLLSRPFSFQPNTTETDRAEKFFKLLMNYYDLSLFRTIKMAAKDCIIYGIGWMCVYYDEDGKLKFKHVPSTEITPEWVDEDHQDLKSVIRKYTVKEFENGTFVSKVYVEYYTSAGMIKYIYQGNGDFNNNTNLVEVQPLTPYFKLNTTEGEVGASWTDIPFIPFKYDADEY